ncbi:unnamed protein product [Gongylonema pulchrum]|uniref:Mediator of RNA polymerase II transcription subunit 13 n=1 Tax=Gongylonema pulchrum TaxID=637853 RepID=A0A183DPF3_9BILA|nr:unnamed protein product [Gongylonema pulchrum]
MKQRAAAAQRQRPVPHSAKRRALWDISIRTGELLPSYPTSHSACCGGLAGVVAATARLRDMVVDKQSAAAAVCAAQLDSYKQPYWTPSPAGPSSSPSSNIRSTPANSNSPATPIMQPPRLPVTMRDSALLSPGGARTPVQQQQMGMCLPVPSPMGSPSAMHPPPSPFIGRPSSNTSASPYMQPPQTPVHYQTNLQSPAGNGLHLMDVSRASEPECSGFELLFHAVNLLSLAVDVMENLNRICFAERKWLVIGLEKGVPVGVMAQGSVPPSSPCAPYPSRMATMGPPQQQYPCHAQVQPPQWSGQQPQQHFVAQPQMVTSVPVQRVMVPRIPYAVLQSALYESDFDFRRK